MVDMKIIKNIAKEAEMLAGEKGSPAVEPEHMVLAVIRKDRVFEQAMKRLMPRTYDHHCGKLYTELVKLIKKNNGGCENMGKKIFYSERYSQLTEVIMYAASAEGRSIALSCDIIRCCCEMGEYSIKDCFDKADIGFEELAEKMLRIDPALQKKKQEEETEKRHQEKIRKETEAAPKNSELPSALRLVSNYYSDGNKGRPHLFAGREELIRQAEQVLTRHGKGNLMLIGKPGVGKTALVTELDRRIRSGMTDKRLEGSTVYELSILEIMAGTMYRGELEEKLLECLNYLENEVRAPICFIDEIHRIIGAGAVSTDPSCTVANFLKPYLVSGRIRFIGATTEDEYRKCVEPDQAISRRFCNVTVEEPSQEEAVRIISGSVSDYAEAYSAEYPAETITKAVELSAKYITERYLPDKAFDILDEAGNICCSAGRDTVTVSDVCTVISRVCNIPPEEVSRSERDRLRGLYDELNKRVFGQEEAAMALSEGVLIGRAGLTAENKPEGIYLMTGPTGVGKTEIAAALADVLGIPLIRYDMSEYSEPYCTSKLIGSPAGYAGFSGGGRLVEDIRRHPRCVLLLDEFEKAHRDVHDLFLQVFDNAMLTDSTGRKADFRHVIILMTSNCGAQDADRNILGFGNGKGGSDAAERCLKETFTPEFRNRLTGVIPFNSISEDMAVRIAQKALGALSELMSAKSLTLRWDNSVVDRIVSEGMDVSFGGRAIMRYVDREIKPVIVREMLFGSVREGGGIRLYCTDEGFEAEALSLRRKARKKTKEAAAV